MNAPRHVLPDLIKPGLKIVFCGTAAGNVSAQLGAYYAHPRNRFWSALHAFGLTPRKLEPEEYPELPQWGLGLTDIAKHVSGMDRELPSGALGRDACAALEAKIRAAEPKWLAFTSLTAGRRYLKRAASFGEQEERIGQTRVWLLPSPSPTAGWNWESNTHWWRMLADRAGGLAAPFDDQDTTWAQPELFPRQRIGAIGLAAEATMNGLIYIVGLIVVIMFILSFLGLR